MSEDLVFFYEHVARGGTFSKVDQVCQWCQCVQHMARLAAYVSFRVCFCHSGHPDLSSHRVVCVVCAVERAPNAGACTPPSRTGFKPHHSDRGLQVRADAFQRIIIPQRGWEKFSIWGCGRDGKRFFHLLSRENKQRVRALCSATLSHLLNRVRDAGGYVRRCC